jgi:glycosyltransferase involved in cell wall biosynthesis
MKLLVFMTAYNEENTIGNVLERVLETLKEIGADADVLVVDDGSSDTTAEIARQYPVKLVVHPTNLGPGVATRTGYEYAVQNNYDYTVRMDADGQHRPEEIPKLLEPIQNDEAEIVIGSRYKCNTGYETSAVRDIGIRFYSWAISMLTGSRVYDLTSGFRALDIEVGEQHAEKLPQGIIAINRGIREGLSDHRIKEVPVTMDQREYGNSYLSVERLAKYPLYSMYSLINALLKHNK